MMPKSAGIRSLPSTSGKGMCLSAAAAGGLQGQSRWLRVGSAAPWPTFRVCSKPRARVCRSRPRIKILLFSL